MRACVVCVGACVWFYYVLCVFEVVGLSWLGCTDHVACRGWCCHRFVIPLFSAWSVPVTWFGFRVLACGCTDQHPSPAEGVVMAAEPNGHELRIGQRTKTMGPVACAAAGQLQTSSKRQRQQQRRRRRRQALVHEPHDLTHPSYEQLRHQGRLGHLSARQRPW